MIPLFIDVHVSVNGEAVPRTFQINEIQAMYACPDEAKETYFVFRNGSTARVVGDYDTVKRAVLKETADVIRYAATTLGSYI